MRQRPLKLKDSTIDRMIDTSARIQKQVIAWLAVLVVAIFVMINPANRDTLMIYGGSVLVIILAIASIVLSALRVRGINNNKPPKAPPPLDLPTGPPARNESSHNIAPGRIVNRTDSTNVLIGNFELSKNEWRKLAITLSNANWKWTRRLLQKTHIWESLTINNKYDVVSSAFAEVGAVEIERHDDGKIKSVRVTSFGRESICELAGTALL